MATHEHEELMSNGNDGGNLIDDAPPRYFSHPPKSGGFSPSAQKVGAELVIWIASLVVIGSLADDASNTEGRRCYSLCVSSIVFAAFSFLILSALLIMHLMTFVGKVKKFGSGGEVYILVIPLLFWIPGVATLSAIHRPQGGPGIVEAPGVAQFFGWLAFFLCIFAAIKAYQAGHEETLKQKMSQRAAEQMRHEDEPLANYS